MAKSSKIYVTEQTKTSFPTWFWRSFWPHMILIDDDENTSQLVPPNQLDWHITMCYNEIDHTWVVTGIKNDFMCGEDADFIQTYQVMDSS